jgi:uncharacterized protein YjeT (DUF2065 family)
MGKGFWIAVGLALVLAGLSAPEASFHRVAQNSKSAFAQRMDDDTWKMLCVMGGAAIIVFQVFGRKKY